MNRKQTWLTNPNLQMNQGEQINCTDPVRHTSRSACNHKPREGTCHAGCVMSPETMGGVGRLQ